jgi:sugar phosphate isomerase/epimerase
VSATERARPPADLSRLSLNQKTTEQWSVAEAVAGCRRAGIGWIGLWREPVAEFGLARTAALVRDAGLRVSSLCRGGFFPTDDPDERRRHADDNRAAVDEAVALGTDVLVLVCGGIAGAALDRSRAQVAEGIADLVPYAAERGVRLGIEPLHPMFCADRSVIVTLAQALDVAERFGVDVVGVVVDTYHLWWDPDVWRQIERATGRIVSYQVCDWLVPLPDPLLGRGLPGDGPIDFARFTRAVAAAGYDGPIEVEIFNADIWSRDGDAVLTDIIERFRTHVG